MRARNIVAGLGLLVSAIGCHHTAGFCDCNPPITPCCKYGLHPTADYSVVTASEVKSTAPAPKPAEKSNAAPTNPPTGSGALPADQIKGE